MISDKLHKIGSLALIRALPKLLVDGDQIKPGRLKNLLKKLERSVDDQLVLIQRMKSSEKDALKSALETFETALLWNEKPKNSRSILSFIILIASSKGWRKIEDIIKDIVEFQERKMPENRRGMCDHAGERAFELWDGLKMAAMVRCDECGEQFDIDSEGCWVDDSQYCDYCEDELTFICPICEDHCLEADRGNIGSTMIILDPGEVTGVSDGIYEIVDNPYYRISILGEGFEFFENAINRLGDVPEDVVKHFYGFYPVGHICEACGEDLKRRAILKRNYRG